MKIPAKKVASDDCVVYVGREISEGAVVNPGEPYRVHEGEWVEIIPIGTVKQTLDLLKMTAAVRTEKPEELEEPLEELCSELATRIIDWNWTDMVGKRLPKPHNNPDAIKAVSEDELLWLITAVRGETAGERKNA